MMRIQARSATTLKHAAIDWIGGSHDDPDSTVEVRFMAIVRSSQAAHHARNSQDTRRPGVDEAAWMSATT